MTNNRSFARTGGRLSDAEAEALAAYGPTYLLGADEHGTVTTLHPEVLPLDDAFAHPDAPLVIEIGAGVGDQAVAYAAAHPWQNVLAVEVWRGGLAGIVLRASREGVTNLRVVQADAATLLGRALPAECAREVWTFFPDPWPKLRHRKRRLVSRSFAASVARVLEPGGVWRLATDWGDYATQMARVLDAAPEFDADPAADGDGWSPRWDGRVLTRYERRGVAAGREVRDVVGIRRA